MSIFSDGVVFFIGALVPSLFCCSPKFQDNSENGIGICIMVHQTNTAVGELRLILDDEPSHLTVVNVALTTSHSLSSLWLVLVERRITLTIAITMQSSYDDYPCRRNRWSLPSPSARRRFFVYIYHHQSPTSSFLSPQVLELEAD